MWNWPAGADVTALARAGRWHTGDGTADVILGNQPVNALSCIWSLFEPVARRYSRRNVETVFLKSIYIPRSRFIKWFLQLCKLLTGNNMHHAKHELSNYSSTWYKNTQKTTRRYYRGKLAISFQICALLGLWTKLSEDYNGPYFSVTMAHQAGARSLPQLLQKGKSHQKNPTQKCCPQFTCWTVRVKLGVQQERFNI